jgi:hypothetical protein
MAGSGEAATSGGWHALQCFSDFLEMRANKLRFAATQEAEQDCMRLILSQIGLQPGGVTEKMSLQDTQPSLFSTTMFRLTISVDTLWVGM